MLVARGRALSLMNTKPRSVLASGFVALDIVCSDQNVWMCAGGTAGNVAANLAYFGWKARIAGLIGHDDVGHIVRRNLSCTTGKHA